MWRNPFRKITKKLTVAAPGLAHRLKPFMLACCGCGRLLNSDGTRGPNVIKGGVLNLAGVSISGVADFHTKEEADAAALANGWKVIDGNHRCPACSFEDSGRRGMYIDTRTIC